MAAAAISGPNGFGEIAKFRINPSEYMRKWHEDEETFVHSLMKILCTEGIQASIKIHLLNTIHEHVNSLISTCEMAEEIVGSLLSVFTQTVSSSIPIVFRGQILVTVTSLAIQYDFQDICLEPFVRIVETLLDVVCHTNKPADGHLRSTACCCLQELETVIPCLLQNKLEYFYQLAQMENGTASQAYVLLLITVLRHTLTHISLLPKEESTPSIVGELLTNRTEPLKPFILPRTTYDSQFLDDDNEPNKWTLQGFDNRELRRLVSFTLDHAHLFTVSSQVRLLSHLANIVRMTPDIASSTFKWVTMRHSRSYDLCYLGLLLQYQELFGTSLVDPDDTASILRSVILVINHPGFTMSHRLILLSILDSPVQIDCDWPRLVCVPQLYRLFPRIFDVCDLQLKKMELLSQLLPSCIPEEDVEELLCSCASLLHQSIESGLGGKHATALFRTFHTFYKNHPNKDSVESTKWMLIRLGENHDRLALRVLDFIEAAQEIHPNTEFAQEILLSMLVSLTKVSHVIRNPKQLANNLVVLQRIARERGLDPEVIISYLQHLVNQDCIDTIGSWELGSLTLSVCRTILAHHDINKVYEGLGHVIYSILMYHPDVDVRDRAGFYYVTMSSISPAKLQSLLAMSNAGARDTQGLANMVKRSTELSCARPVTRLERPMLKLTRMPCGNPSYTLHQSVDDTFLGLVEKYMALLKTDENVRYIKLKAYLHFNNVDEGLDLDEIFALVLQVNASSSYHDIKDTKIPVMRTSDSSSPNDQCCTIDIVLEPKEPGPTEITGEAIFTAGEGQTLLSFVEGFSIKLEDIWSAIPSPDISSLFPKLWEYLVKAGQPPCLDGPVQSLIYLGISEATLKQYVDGTWKDLRVNLDDRIVTLADEFSPAPRAPHDKNGENGIEETRTGFYHLGIFLPPSHHILVEIIPNDKHMVVYIVTDKPALLALFTAYLREIESSNVQYE